MVAVLVTRPSRTTMRATAGASGFCSTTGAAETDDIVSTLTVAEMATAAAKRRKRRFIQPPYLVGPLPWRGDALSVSRFWPAILSIRHLKTTLDSAAKKLRVSATNQTFAFAFAGDKSLAG
jgi:hypothetical protein